MSVPAKNIACVLIGEESLLVECGNQLRDRGYTIAAIIAANEQLVDWAASVDAEVLSPAKDLEKQLQPFEYDWFFSIANLSMLPRNVWQKARLGAINFHDGPLPDFAGLNTPAWAIARGEATHGITWHALADGADTGDIYVQRRFEIAPDETTFTLNTRCFEAGIASFSELLDKMEGGGLTGQAQSFETRKYFAKNDRPENGATLDFSKTSEEIDRTARALDYGPIYANPLCLPKIKTGAGAYNVGSVTFIEGKQGVAGTVLSADDESLDVATANGAVRLSMLTDTRGKPVKPNAIVKVQEALPRLSDEEGETLTAFLAGIVPHEAFFRKKLSSFRDLEIHGSQPAGGNDVSNIQSISLSPGHDFGGTSGASAILAALVRLSDHSRFDVALINDALTEKAGRFTGYVGPMLPLTVTAAEDATVETFEADTIKTLNRLAERGGFTGDLISRTPGLDMPAASVAIRLTSTPESATAAKGSVLTFIVPEQPGAVQMLFDQGRLDEAEAQALAGRLQLAIKAYAEDRGSKIADLPLMSKEAEQELVVARNLTERNYDRTALVHQLIEAQVEKTPDATALVCEDRSLTYAELDAQANAVAQKLVERGVGPDSLVGIYMRRSVDLVVAALGIWKAGAAYVPLDPTYPRDRIALMIEDSGFAVVLTQRFIAASIPAKGPEVIAIEDVTADDMTAVRPQISVQPENLAYVIYTSGSTGRPKGVMVEHRNVVNFFAGMDDRVKVPTDKQPVWLAVTSLSFDISVLELFWTLTRGFKVVIHVDNKQEISARPKRKVAHIHGRMDFSLFYWGHDDTASTNKYKLLLESAKFADTRGFQAIWTPERHFHAFGGPYPNPAVTGAAVASITKNLEIRAGCCVVPLHHPARIAEEWAIVDNLTNGRTGLGFASGWMPEDFLLRAENAPPNNKTAMMRDIEIVRRLWRGEAVQFEAPDGSKMIDVVTQPRPVQGELPVWMTIAGNPQSYRDAGRIGANVLTHLLGQSIAEVGEKIKIYHEALREAGRNPVDHKVTLMLHTLVGYDREEAREAAREPMKDYLRSAAALIKEYVWTFPAFKRPQGAAKPADIDIQSLSAEELDAILDFAFLRYFDDSGFFGTVDDAIARADELKAIGVDEIACLIDFGVSHDVALQGLAPLAEVVAHVNPQVARSAAEEELDYGVAALIERHGVTHIQCTPSMATMLLLNDEERQAMRSVHHLFIGGEALQAILARDLHSVTDATIENMYGPTETTIWSSTATVGDIEANAPLGTAIANTQLYILDSKLRPVPPGVPGELFIGGDGVTRGYLNREELTQERFLPNPFVPSGRIYRTGDLVRIGPDGEIQFIGRTDHQVKVRGYRIELGEIEARLGQHPAVAEAVVVAREDKANDVRIVAYVRFKSGFATETELADHVRATLPEYMVPVHFVKMDSFPLTPNAKVDRKALPRPSEVKYEEEHLIEFIVPADEVQQRIAETFKSVLGVERVGAMDNFFKLGGHSLLAVLVHRDLKKNVAPQLSITDIYRFPTVSGLAEHIQGSSKADDQLSKIADRAAMRRNAMGGRRNFSVRDREAS